MDEPGSGSAFTGGGTQSYRRQDYFNGNATHTMWAKVSVWIDSAASPASAGPWTHHQRDYPFCEQECCDGNSCSFGQLTDSSSDLDDEDEAKANYHVSAEVSAPNEVMFEAWARQELDGTALSIEFEE